MNSGLPYRFEAPIQPGLIVNMDLMRHLGTAFIVVKPGGGRYRVDFGGRMFCELEVNSVDLDEHKEAAPPSPSSTSRRAEASVASAVEVKEYFDRVHVLQFVQGLLHTVVKTKPQDPCTYMAKQCLGGWHEFLEAAAFSSPGQPKSLGAGMEVGVINHRHVPAGSIMLIRSGACRRQGPVRQGRSFQFPTPMEPGRVLQVEILKQLGSAFIVVNPGGGRYKIAFSDHSRGSRRKMTTPDNPKRPSRKTNMNCCTHCEVQVTDLNCDSICVGRNTPVQEGQKRCSVDQGTEARDYLEQRKLLQSLHGVLQKMTKEKPQDPYLYMARRFLGANSTDTDTAIITALDGTQAGSEESEEDEDSNAFGKKHAWSEDGGGFSSIGTSPSPSPTASLADPYGPPAPVQQRPNWS